MQLYCETVCTQSRSEESCDFLTGLMTDFLESLEHSERRRRVDQVGNRYEGTFNWLFDPEVGFRGWLSGPQQAGTPIIFWIQGKPGSGKSTLMKYALAEKKTREFLALADPGNWHLVPFFFHDRGSSIQKSVTGLLQELLYKLIEANEKLLAFIPSRLKRLQQRYGENKRPGYVYQISPSAETWSVDDLQEVLTAITGQDEVSMNVLFFIDALDEHEGNHRDLIRVISNSFIARGASKVNVKFCLASRPDPAFIHAFGSCPGLLVHEYTKDDVQWYARHQIASSIQYQDIDQDMSELHQLTVEITQRANGVFIWVRIVIEELVERFIDGSTISQLRDILSAMPEELKDLYQRAVSKVKPEYALESYVMAQIVLYAKNPQSLESLLVATDVALQRKVEPMSRATMERRLGSRCGGLLEKTSTSNQIQFLHQTVKTFFIDRHHAISMFRQSEYYPAKDGSYYMLKYCVYVATRLPSAELVENLQTLRYLFTYARESLIAPESEVGELLECLLQYPRRCAFFPWEVLDVDLDGDPDGLQRFCSHSVRYANTPLQEARQHSRHRYHDLLTVSLAYGVLAYAQHKITHGLPRTPPRRWPLLHSAVSSAFLACWAPGHRPETETPLDTPKLVNWLFQKGADPNERCRPLGDERNNEGPTALGFMLAASRIYPLSRLAPPAWSVIYKTIETLLKGGANPNMIFVVEGRSQMSALRLAIIFCKIYRDNCVEIVRILLEYEADCHQIDAEGYRPLYYAISDEHWQAAELLLQYGANPSDLGNGINALQPDSFRHEPIHRGAIRMQALLRDYSIKSERQSRRNSVTAEDTQ